MLQINKEKNNELNGIINVRRDENKHIFSDANEKLIIDKQIIFNIIKENIEIGKTYEKYDKLYEAREYYVYAEEELSGIAIIGINKYAKKDSGKKNILILENMNNKDKQLFNEIIKEMKIREEISENINRINKKIKMKNEKQIKKSQDEYLETLLRREDLYFTGNA